MLCTRREKKSSSGKDNSRGTRCSFTSVFCLGPPHCVTCPLHRWWLLPSASPISNRAAVALQTSLHCPSTDWRLTRTTCSHQVNMAKWWSFIKWAIRWATHCINLSPDAERTSTCTLAAHVHWKAEAAACIQGKRLHRGIQALHLHLVNHKIPDPKADH